MSSLQLFHAHVEAFNDGDLERLLAGFAEDAEWSTGGYTVRGIGALAVFFGSALDGLRPELLVRSVVGSGDLVAAELTELFRYDHVDRVSPIAAFYRFHDGAIVRATIYREGSAEAGDARAAPGPG